MRNTSLHYIFFAFFFGGLLRLHLSAQNEELKCKAFYKQAIDKSQQRDLTAAYDLAVTAELCFMELHDTLRACGALHLQATVSSELPVRAMAALDKAIGYYESRDWVDYTYFKIWSAKIQVAMQLGHFQEAIDLSTEVSAMDDRLIQNDPQKGRDGVYEKDIFLANLLSQNGLTTDAMDAMAQAQAFYEREGRFAKGQLLANGYSIFSQVYRRVGDLPHAAQYNRLARQVLEAEPEQTPRVISNILGYQNDYAIILEDASQYEEARNLLQAVIAHKKTLPFAKEQDLVNNYANLGHVYMKMAELQLAQDFSRTALLLYAQMTPPPISLLAKANITMAAIQRKSNQPKEALEYAHTAVKILGSKGTVRGQIVSLAWREAALAYLAMALADSARGCLRNASKATEINFPNLATSDSQHTVGDGWLALANSGTQRHADSIAELISFSHEGCWPNAVSETCRADFDSAFVCMQRALNATFRSPEQHASALEIPFGAIFAEEAFLQGITGMGDIYRRLYDLTLDTTCLSHALQYYQRGAAYLAYVDAGRTSIGLQHYKWEQLWKKHLPMLQAAVECSALLFKRSSESRYAYIALTVADMSKGRQVAKRQAAAQASAQGGLPRAFLQREHQIRRRMERARISGIQLRDEQEVLTSLEQVATCEYQLQQLLDSLKRYAPNAYRQRFENQANFDMTQKAIYAPVPPHCAELEYFVGGDSIYAFLKTPDTLLVAIVSGRASLSSQVDTLNAQIRRRAPEKDFAPTAARLWQRLLPFKLQHYDIHQLCIVPDDFLSQVPFPALVLPSCLPTLATKGPTYMADLVAINYDFSLTAQHATNEFPSQPVSLIHGFFPHRPLIDATNGDTVASAINFTHELDALAAQIPSRIDTADAATKQRFALALQSSGILELTTHGEFTEREGLSIAYLLLRDPSVSDGNLMASELYSMPDIQTQLLVLNACYMSKGKFLAGEGALSMTHAFRLAGCPSLLATNWEASPAANEEILADFYQGLWDQQTATQALRTAQQNAIHHDQAARRHPYFWASLALYGRPGMLTFASVQSTWPWWWVVGSIAMLILLLTWRRKRILRRPLR
jgi:CHAT domain-containing protein